MGRMGWWNVEGWPLPEEWSAFFAFLSVLVTIGAATVALLQLGAWLRDREEQSRPYVFADFAFRSTIMSIEITNSSLTPATNVRLSVSPPIRASDREREEMFHRVFSDDYRVSMLSPGRSIRWSLDSTPTYYANKALPRQYEVTLTYDDPRASARREWWHFWRARLKEGTPRRSSLTSTSGVRLLSTRTTTIRTGTFESETKSRSARSLRIFAP